MNPTFQHWWRVLLGRVGVQGLVGAALLVAALVLALWTPELMHKEQRLREAVHQLAVSHPETHVLRAGPEATLEQLQQFANSFPTRERNGEDLKLVFAAAKRNKVALPKGEYQVVTESNSPFVAYALTFPIREGYGDIKKFTADVMRTIPNAEIGELRLERGEALGNVLDARIRISLIYRAS